MADSTRRENRADQTLGEMLNERGVSRRSFLKFASYTASILALPPTAATAIAEGLEQARRQSVIWLSFQECTGCTESITRASSPSIEDLIFDFISLDYHHTLQNASGHAAEEARMQAMQENAGEYIVVVDGSVPLKDDGIYSTIAGITNLQMLEETVKDAFAVIAVGSCATFGGIPGANPNPTGAVPITHIVTVRQELRRRGRTPGLVPVRSGLQRPGHLQRLRHAQVERRHVFPDPVGARLPGLLRTGFLGPRRFLQTIVDRQG